jgi:hypothetical protein
MSVHDSLRAVDSLAAYRPHARNVLSGVLADQRVDEAEPDLRKDLQPGELPGPLELLAVEPVRRRFEPGAPGSS